MLNNMKKSVPALKKTLLSLEYSGRQEHCLGVRADLASCHKLRRVPAKWFHQTSCKCHRL
jgi:hypothetical protein